MNQPKLSICISVHNTAEFLPRCLDSLVNQTVSELEIVLVNNGSTDTSESIMKQFKRTYPERRIIIVTQNDRGLAQGRQTGIEHANGEYIAFLDADDFVTIDAYEKMLSFAQENHVDIVEIETRRGNELLSSPYLHVTDAREYLAAYFWGKDYIHPMIWMRLYKHTLFRKKVMPDFYVNNEDVFAFPCLLYQAKTIGFIKEPLHVYSIDNENAVMIELKRKREYADRYYKNRKKYLRAIEHIENFIGKDELYATFGKSFDQYKQRLMVTFLFSDVFGISFDQKLNDLKQELGFESKRDVVRFLKAQTRNHTRVNTSIRLVGVRNSYYIHVLRKVFQRLMNQRTGKET